MITDHGLHRVTSKSRYSTSCSFLFLIYLLLEKLFFCHFVLLLRRVFEILSTQFHCNAHTIARVSLLDIGDSVADGHGLSDGNDVGAVVQLRQVVRLDQ